MNSKGVIEAIKGTVKGEKYGLGYVHTDDEVRMKKSGNQAQARTIPHFYHSFNDCEYADRYGLVEGIWGLFEEIDDVIEDQVKLLGIRNVKPREQQRIQNFTTTMIP